MEEKKKGGKRDNAGRKPSDDPKMPITVYIETSKVLKNGGKVQLAQRIIDTVASDFEQAESIDEPIPKPFKKGFAKTVKVTNLTPEKQTSDYTIDTIKHKLWKEGDPKEGSMAFFSKYGAASYDEIGKKKNEVDE